MAQEGQVANGPNGQRAVYTNGQWVVIPPNAQPVTSVDPRIQPDIANTQASTANAAANAQRTRTQTQVEAATAPAQVATAQLQPGYMWIDPNNPSAGMKRIPVEGDASVRPNTKGQAKADELFAQEYVDWQAAGGFAGLQTNLKLLEDALDIIENSDTITGPAFGRLPKFIQQSVNPDSQNVKADVERVIQQSLKQILGAQFAQKEAEQLFARSFDPTQDEASNAKRIRATLDQLRTQGAVRDSSMRYFEENGTITGWKPPSGSQSGGRKAAGVGATTTLEDVPPEYQAAYDNFLNNIWDGTPEQYARFRTSLDERYFPGQAENQYHTYLEEGYNRSLNRDAGNTQIPPAERQMTDVEQARNNLVSSPTGTAAANYLDSATLGLGSLAAPDKFQAANELNPNAALLGQVGGAITGTGAVGQAGRRIAGRFAPALLAGGGKSRFARNLATDAGYSAAYGANTGQDPLESALWGAVGSAGGQALGKAVSLPLTGIKGSQAAQYLSSRGIPLTAGQKIGGPAKSLEDAATSLPVVGDIINARRLEGLQAFNRAAFDEAGKPIGFTSQRIGREGATDLMGDSANNIKGAVGKAYDTVLSGLDTPLDAQFLQDMGQAVQPLQSLPADIRRPMGEVMNARIQPIADADRLTGPSYQAARRTLKATRNKVPTRFEGYEPEYQDAAGALIDALDAQVERGAGPEIVEGLNNANQANRLGKIVQAATERGKGGSGSGEVRTFTPSQLQMANQASGRKFPGINPLIDLADEGQRVLPSRIPDSGTPKRLMQAALGTTVLGGAGGYDYLSESNSNALGTTLAALALLSAGGTRTGQKALTEGILPSDAKKLRAAAKRIPGIFGSASIPLFVNQ